MSSIVRIGNILRSWGIITDDQAVQAIIYHKNNNCRFGQALIALGYASKTQIEMASSFLNRIEEETNSISLAELEEIYIV